MIPDAKSFGKRTPNAHIYSSRALDLCNIGGSLYVNSGVTIRTEGRVRSFAARRIPSKWLALFTSFTLILASVPCWGWGREGHQVVAIIAEDHLNETTKVMIQSLIGNNHLYSVAMWADDMRKERKDTAPWHYVNIPLGGTYNATRNCEPPRSCVVVKIEEFMRVLTDKSKSRDERAQALKFVVHFVGDIHQPMHSVIESAGGNGVHVKFFERSRCGRYECNLHAVWDSDLIEHTALSREEYVRHEEELVRSDKLEVLAGGTPEEWADESLKLAEGAWVPDGTDLDERYYKKQIKVVDRQMALAGLRLAKLLNESIGKMTPRDFASSSSAAEKSALNSEDVGQSRSSDLKVWVNAKSGAYHCPSSRWYGHTKQGGYMSESEAVKNGYHPAGGKSCQSIE